MKKKCFCLLLALTLSLLGCSADEQAEPQAPSAESEALATPPVSTVALAEIPACPAKITLDTCAETSGYWMAETADGYYLQFEGCLFYADKADLTQWVCVCGQPGCLHKGSTCPASLDYWGFFIQNDRIYTLRNTDMLNPEFGSSEGLYSMTLNGSDLRLEQAMTPERLDYEMGVSSLFAPDSACVCYFLLDTEGVYQYHFQRIYEDRVVELYTASSEDQLPPSLTSGVLHNHMHGDAVFYSQLLSGGMYYDRLYRLTENGYEEIPNICQYDLSGAYLQGKDLYRFVPDDGYYYTDLDTGTSVKWMDAQIADSTAACFATDFIVETNLHLDPVSNPLMQIYDGDQWMPVALPNDFWPDGEAQEYGLQVLALTTTALFLRVNHLGEGTATLYAVDLTADNLEAVFCAEFGT